MYFVLSKVSCLQCFYLAAEAALQTWDDQILHIHNNQLKLQRRQEKKTKQLLKGNFYFRMSVKIRVEMEVKISFALIFPLHT